MPDALWHTLRDPINLAIPFFVLTVVIELTALYLLDRDDDRFDLRIIHG